MSLASMAGMGGANQIASLFVKIGADARQFESAMGGVERRLSVVGGAVSKLGAFAAAAAVGGIAAVGAGLTMALKSSAEFERVMSGAGAVLGANNDQMERLNNLALQLGKDTAFSAAEAASAIEMLAKNGVKTEQILGGMADATVALAAATGASLPTAADVATDAMMQFGLSTEQVSRAINGISGVVVNSKFDINDYALALSQGGGVAAKVGVSFDDFNTTIAAISSAFGSGSDAGTSFKVFLQRLVPQSKEAASTMAQLGLMTADGSNAFFDASGNMKSMADIAGLLQNAFGGLSDAARIDALSTIFGTDAMRTAATLAEVGTKRFNEIAVAMSKVDAAGQAANRLDNLAGDVEQLSGSFETLKIKLGQAFTPLARKGVQFITEKLNKLIDLDFDHFAEMATRGLNAIGGTTSFVKTGVTSLVKGFQKMRGMVGLLRPFAGPLKDLLTQFKTGFSIGFDKTDFSGPVKGIFTGLINMWLSAERWMLGTGLPALMTTLGRWGAALVEWIGPQVPGILSELGSMVGELVQWLGGSALPAIGRKLGEWGAAFVDWIEPQIPPLISKMGGLLRSLGNWITDTALPALSDKLAEWGAAFVEWVAPQIPLLREKLGELWKSVTSWITDGDKRSALVAKLVEWAGAFADWAGGIWNDYIKPGLTFAWGWLSSWITDGDKRSALVEKLGDWAGAFADWANGIWKDYIKPGLTFAWDWLSSWITDPKKRAELIQNLKDKWTGFRDWANDIWLTHVKPKMEIFKKFLDSWISENAPEVKKWAEEFKDFFEDVKSQFDTQLPFIETRWSQFQIKIGEELAKINEAFGGVFGQGGSIAGFGKFFADVMITIGNVFLTLIESMVIKLRVLAESFKAIWEIGQALAKGDMAGAAAGMAQLGQAISGFADVWQTWRDLIDRTMQQWNPLPNGEPVPPPGGWFGENGNSGSGTDRTGMRALPASSGWVININVDPGTIPTDRSKLQELARAIWREAEMSGLRL